VSIAAQTTTFSTFSTFPTPARPTHRRAVPGMLGLSVLPWAKVLSRRYHFTIASFAYAATTCVLVVGAVNGQNNLLFWVFGLAVAGLLISGVISGWSLMGVHIHRRVLGETSAGEALEIEYTISNSNYIFGAFGLLLEELPEGRNWLGKRFGATWPAHVAPLRTFIAYVPPRRSITVRTSTPALRRGDATLGPMRVASTFPFGITRKSITFLQDDTILIRPQIVDLSPTITLAGGARRSESRTMTRTRSGDEMFALREYASGDSTRSIAWRASARLDRPVVRDPGLRKGRRVWIVLDDAAQGQDEETLERAIAFAAGLIALGVREGCQVGFASLSRGPIMQPSGFAPGARSRAAFDLLARYSNARSAVASNAQSQIETIPRSDGLLLVSETGGRIRDDAMILNPLAASNYRDATLPTLPPVPDPALLGSAGTLLSALDGVRGFLTNLVFTNRLNVRRPE